MPFKVGKFSRLSEITLLKIKVHHLDIDKRNCIDLMNLCWIRSVKPALVSALTSIVNGLDHFLDVKNKVKKPA